ncbi:hypothetical protein COLO4_03321 [Corchorus olitorius]|uniref:Uncharacterized protein n=1 Tax=Corchorus olitorius TaxID=93759 RepID=A0A1R3KZ10_9ROSI|nr:hypothetical protein COLO4_03321 [Corchorus olitorius]
MFPKRLQDGEPVQEDVRLNGSQKTETPDELEILYDRTPIQINDDLEEASLNTTSAKLKMLDKNSAKLQVLTSKDQILSKTALNVLLYKGNNLALKQREIGDEIALYDQMIQNFSNGGDDHDITDTIWHLSLQIPHCSSS